MDMTPAHPDAVIDCSSYDRGAAAARKLAEVVADSLRAFGYAALRIGRLRLSERNSRSVAHDLLDSLRDQIVSSGAPSDLFVEHDKVQTTIMPTAGPVRTMLPHHDGQHASFLTPSAHTVPGWNAGRRVFSEHGFTTTRSHKLYQAIFIADPGEGLSVTTHLNLVHLLRDAYAIHTGRNVDAIDLSDVQRWYDENLSRLLESSRLTGSTYPTLAGILGIEDPTLAGTALIRCEAALPDAWVEAWPNLRALMSRCACGSCDGDTLRVFCHVVARSLGLSAPEFFAHYETWLVSERYDLLITNNIASMHGGRAGGASRVLEPSYLAVPRPEGEAYESWLQAAWDDLAAAPRPAEHLLG